MCALSDCDVRIETRLLTQKGVHNLKMPINWLGFALFTRSTGISVSCKRFKISLRVIYVFNVFNFFLFQRFASPLRMLSVDSDRIFDQSEQSRNSSDQFRTLDLWEVYVSKVASCERQIAYD